MSYQIRGFYFSGNADKSANDYTLFVDGNAHDSSIVTLGARYKNSEPNSLYQIEMDAEDVAAFGQMCLDFARQMKAGEA